MRIKYPADIQRDRILREQWGNDYCGQWKPSEDCFRRVPCAVCAGRRRINRPAYNLSPIRR